MPRYFFNSRDGYEHPDAEGTELPDLRSAREQAIRLFGAMVYQEGFASKFGDDWHMDVLDEAGQLALRLRFTITEMPER